MRYLFFFTLGVLLQVPSLVFAQSGGNPGQGGGGNAGQGGGGNPGQGGGSGGSVTLQNPLRTDSIIEFFQDLLSVLLVFAVPLIVFFIIFAGFKYVMAQGKPDEIATANRALLYAIIGGLIILGAYVILEVIEGTVNAFRS